MRLIRVSPPSEIPAPSCHLNLLPAPNFAGDGIGAEASPESSGRGVQDRLPDQGLYDLHLEPVVSERLGVADRQAGGLLRQGLARGLTLQQRLHLTRGQRDGRDSPEHDPRGMEFALPHFRAEGDAHDRKIDRIADTELVIGLMVSRRLRGDLDLLDQFVRLQDRRLCSLPQ